MRIICLILGRLDNALVRWLNFFVFKVKNQNFLIFSQSFFDDWMLFYNEYIDLCFTYSRRFTISSILFILDSYYYLMCNEIPQTQF